MPLKTKGSEDQLSEVHSFLKGPPAFSQMESMEHGTWNMERYHFLVENKNPSCPPTGIFKKTVQIANFSTDTCDRGLQSFTA